jgi:hypothetical protein
MDSSAAITRITRSIPDAPASMFLTNRSCPGTSTNPTRRSGGQVQVRETEIDRNAAPLFFFQAIGIDARERSDERSFSVIDVASGAGDNPHGRTAYFKGVTLIL